MTVRIGINGFGRIGKIVFRQMFERLKHHDVQFFINDLASPQQIRYALLCDSNYGAFHHQVIAHENGIKINDQMIPIYKETSPENEPCNWNDPGIFTEFVEVPITIWLFSVTVAFAPIAVEL